jgi:hypothetical protein
MSPEQFKYGDILRSNHLYGSYYLYLGQSQCIGLAKTEDGFRFTHHSNFSRDTTFFRDASRVEGDSFIIQNNTNPPNIYSMAHFLFNRMTSHVYAAVFLRRENPNNIPHQAFILNVYQGISNHLNPSPFVLAVDSMYIDNYILAPKKFKLKYEPCR